MLISGFPGREELNKMKFNKAECAAVASQPSTKFDKEGVLFIREKSERFYKRTEGKFYAFNLCIHFISI